MTSRALLPLLALLSTAACHRPDRTDSNDVLNRALSGLFIYPYSTQLGMTAGQDAGEARLTTVDSIGKVAAWFRTTLRLNHWTLESDVVAGDTMVTIYATNAERPVWITLHANVGGPGTTYSVVGAITTTDTTQRSGSSMSSKRIQRR